VMYCIERRCRHFCNLPLAISLSLPFKALYLSTCTGTRASMSVSREEGSMTSPMMHVPLCPDQAFLVGCSGGCTLCPCSAISGHHDGDLVSLTRRVYRKFTGYFAHDHCCWRTAFPLRWNSCLTSRLSRAWKPQRSGGWKASAAGG
jgi:hypothetical protein